MKYVVYKRYEDSCSPLFVESFDSKSSAVCYLEKVDALSQSFGDECKFLSPTVLRVSSTRNIIYFIKPI